VPTDTALPHLLYENFWRSTGLAGSPFQLHRATPMASLAGRFVARSYISATRESCSQARDPAGRARNKPEPEPKCSASEVR
jgi:hypothetical protein